MKNAFKNSANTMRLITHIKPFYWLSFGLLVLTGFNASAQTVLTADSAVRIALKNNFDILVAGNDLSITKENNTAGNAGMLPTVAGNVGGNYAVNSVHQKSATGSQSYTNNSNTANASVALSWTVFDGGKMFVTKNKLAEIQALGELQFKDKVQATIYNVLAAYYNVVKQKQQLQLLQKVINYNQERVKLLQAGFNVGLTPKNTYLQAQIDLNVNRENVILQRNVITNARRTLNQLLALGSDTLAYQINDTIAITYQPDKADMLKKLEASNASVLALQKQIDVARLSLKEAKALYLPRVNLTGGYYYSQTNNQTGSVLQNQSTGPQVGGSISIPIYQAGNVRRQVSVAKLQASSAEYALASLKLQINTQLINALTDFDNQTKLIEIESSNKELAKENLEIAMQRLRLGQTTPLEVRQAQQSYEDALTRFLNFSYNLKLSETKLKQLVGQL